jgi:hypothetical protein
MKQETMKVRITRATDDNWYKVDEEYEVLKNLLCTGAGDYYPLPDDKNAGIDPEDCEIVAEKQSEYPFSVLCVDDELAEGYLRKGNVYTVIGEYQDVDYVLKEVKMTWGKSRFEIVSAPANILEPQEYVPDPEEENAIERNKYMRQVKPGVWVDVYDVLRAWNVVDPCLQHLLKKALASGQRGHKDLKEDLEDILASAKRAVEMHEEWTAPYENEF